MELRKRLQEQPDFESIRKNIKITTLNAWGWNYVRKSAINPKLVTTDKEQINQILNVLQPAWGNHQILRDKLTHSRKKFKTAKDLFEVIDKLKTLGLRHDYKKVSSVKEHIKFLMNSGLKIHWDALVKKLENMELLTTEDSVDKLFESVIYKFWSDAVIQSNNRAFYTLEDQKYWSMIEVEKQIASGNVPTGSGRYDCIIVDEFQDINLLDLNLLKAIAQYYNSDITIIGDDDQAIYEWRGATPSFILSPEKYIAQDYITYILSKNYRCPANIVNISQNLIKNNLNRVDKDIYASSASNADIDFIVKPNPGSSINSVFEKVEQIITNNPNDTIALIGRKRSQILPYQVLFTKYNIPFNAQEDLHLLLSEAFDGLSKMLSIKSKFNNNVFEINDILFLINKVGRYHFNTADREKILQILNNGIVNDNNSLSDILDHIDKVVKPVSKIADPIKNFTTNSKTVSETLLVITNDFKGFEKDYGKSIDDIFYTDPPFTYLVDFAYRYSNNFQGFLHDIETAKSTLAIHENDWEDDVAGSKKLTSNIHLMTALRAKGKEFTHVFVLDVNNGVWPCKKAETPEKLEEERRLFYVAITRVKKHLYLSINKTILDVEAPMSPYLAETFQGTDFENQYQKEALESYNQQEVTPIYRYKKRPSQMTIDEMIEYIKKADKKIPDSEKGIKKLYKALKDLEEFD